MSGDPMMHTCINTGDWTAPCYPCPVCQRMSGWSVGTYTLTPASRMSDDDIERIARRVAELLKGEG